MATYKDIITGALLHLGVRAAESPLTPSEVQDGLTDLNDMGSEWEESGIRVGFTPSLDADSELIVPRYAIAAYKAGLALRIAPAYARIITPALSMLATESKTALIRSVVNLDNVDYPSTLPVGSGNECYDTYDTRFFPDKTGGNF